jgi:hypothetical protein
MKEHNMKRIVVLLATLLLSFGLTNAANLVQITASGNNPASPNTDTLRADVEGIFTVGIENDALLGGISLGFIMNGTATWTMVNKVGGFPGISPATSPKFLTGIAGTRWMTANATDGSCWDLGGTNVTFDPAAAAPLNQQWLVGGAALAAGLQPGGMQDMLQAHYMIDHLASNDDVEMLCIDSMKYPPAGDFIFVPGGTPGFSVANPATGETNCWPVTNPRNFCPVISNANPSAMSINHCGVGQMTVTATDNEGDPIYFYLVSSSGAGTATVGENSGLVTYTPAAADVGNPVTIVVEATDPLHQQGGCVDGALTINVTVTNNAPTITCGKDPEFIGKGNTLVKTDIHGSDADACDVLQYSLADDGGFVTPPVVNPANGAVTIATEDLDVGDHNVCVAVTDGFTTAQCCFTVTVLAVEPWEVQIEKTHQTLQGHFVDVDLTLNKGSEPMGGFDFLVAYDASALAFTEATLGSYLQGCGWEYFTYRFNWNGNCGNACPSGLLRIVGLAETNNGPNHPDVGCITNATGHVIATLTFFVSNDRTLECMYVPIRFYWMDCGDNTISTIGGDTLAISRYVYDINGSELQDNTFGFPGWYGAPDLCLEGDKVTPIRFVDFRNGGIDIVCGDSIDARGDINANGITYEIADAVMFTNYFISGLSAFDGHVESSIAASDVNADGITLSVADLVYLIRVVVGDANPYPKPMPDAQAIVRAQGGAVTVDAPLNLGAALLTFHVNGEIGEPVLGVDMDMKYAREGDELRVLVYNIGNKAIPAGQNLLVTVPGNVELTGAEVASYEGSMVQSTINRVPLTFSLDQNYPNPFNPTTTIALNMPVESDYSITIFNVAGQRVREYAGHSAAGVLHVVWDGTDASGNSVASGIYFYRATTDKFSETKKMVLMK